MIYACWGTQGTHRLLLSSSACLRACGERSVAVYGFVHRPSKLTACPHDGTDCMDLQACVVSRGHPCPGQLSRAIIHRGETVRCPRLAPSARVILIMHCKQPRGTTNNAEGLPCLVLLHTHHMICLLAGPLLHPSECGGDSIKVIDHAAHGSGKKSGE